MRLDGKTALITEVGQALGGAVALAFTAAGANVVINSRSDRSSAEAAADHVLRAGGDAIVANRDLSRPDEVDRLAGEAEARYERVDILVNSQVPLARRAFLAIEPEDWDTMIGASLHAAFYCARRLLPSMLETGQGRIINVSSIDVFLPVRQQTHFMTCNAGLIGLTRALAKEFGPSGVTVNAVIPGLLETGASRRIPDRAMASMVPAGRLGRPEEIGKLCVFLASEAGAYINGQSIHCNGGRLMA